MENIDWKIEEILIECEVAKQDIHTEDFLESGILESMQIAEIVMAMEERFDIEFDGEDIVPENFRNLNTMKCIVEKYLEEKSQVSES